ncbi:MAG: hypothetical protein D6B25_15525 [Desulfobulbaceae bacterium]|nr:MAG: hypothetical protein D6B25_15525 [Desulfobulbaceae bacterium]
MFGKSSKQTGLMFSVQCVIFLLFLVFSKNALSDDSSCIVCHTDIDLLEENLGKTKTKKSALQAGSG